MKKSEYILLSLDDIRENGNHLINESSVYLQQHAHNPVDWYPWGDEALGRSKNEDKPIFLSVGYSSCHWCHVMEEEVFENDAIATYLNKFFVNIKVDREERPDLDTVFMQSIQMLTGKGGWPMSVFLTPDLKPFYGGTYYPPQTFSELITHLNGVFRNKRDIVEAQGNDLYERISGTLPVTETNSIINEDIDKIVQNALQNVDRQYGGFRDAMKFPTPLRWQFLLHFYRLTGDEEVGKAVRLTLDNMGSGGIHDHIGGGFHRYTVDHIWLIPHFEKMLYDNAQLASLYLEAFAVFKDKRYGEIASDTLDFMIRDMHEENSGFFGSYDADSGGQEGTYYTWTESEIAEVVGSQDAPVLSKLLGIKDVPNFEGSNVLSRRENEETIAEEFGWDINEVRLLVEKYREELREVRDQRIKPGLDKKIVTSWNGLAISALSQGYMQFGEIRYRDAAISAAEYLLNTHKKADGSFYRTSTAGHVKGNAILDDYAFLANGLFDLFQATSEVKYLAEALNLLNFVQDNFRNTDGGYFLTPEGTEAPLGRQIDFYDAVEPSGNSALMMAFIKASALTGDIVWREEVKRVIGYYTDIIQRAGVDMGKWLDVVNFLNNLFHEIVIAGEIKSGNGEKLHQTLNEISPSYSVFTNVVEKNKNELVSLIPSIKDKTAVDTKTTAYVCEYGSCQAPTNDVDEFEKQVRSGWSY